MQVEGFPNMFMVMGPHTALGNIPRSIEYSVEWVTGILRHMHENGLTRAECRPEGVKDWTDHVKALGEGLLSNEKRDALGPEDHDAPLAWRAPQQKTTGLRLASICY